MTTFVAYYRVSTDKQGVSGLGIDAQRAIVTRLIGGGVLLATFVEVESGKRADRPQLALAVERCREVGATLIVAKLDRLARDAKFLLTLVDNCKAGVLFGDLPSLPTGPVGRFLLTQMAAVAELEAGLISQRTRAALAVAKDRGIHIGRPQAPEAARVLAQRLHGEGRSLRSIAGELAAAGYMSNGAAYGPSSVRCML